jgi:hypothetical protein
MTEPSRWVEPEVSEARIERLWQGVEHGLEQRAPRRWGFLLLATAVCAAAAWAVFSLRAPQLAPVMAQAVLAGARLETASDSLKVSLVDGSALELAARTRLEVQGNQPSSVALALAHGQVSCDVTHRSGRAFTVVAADVEVRVVGTQFSVRSTPEAGGTRVEVSVQRGVVEIRSGRDPGSVARVSAGQSWSQAPQLVPAAPVVTAVPPARPAKPEEPAAAPSASVAPAGPTARELFEKAGERRRAGDAAAAARGYEELLKLHPGDARASLAAFELGRLRMDRLGDAAGASAALERAVALNVGPSFREDALARLVSVYAAQGNFAACGRARDRYLQSYPNGVHAGAVSSRCGKR